MESKIKVNEVELIYALKESIDMGNKDADKIKKGLNLLIKWLYEKEYAIIPQNICEYYKFLKEIPCNAYLHTFDTEFPFIENGMLNSEVQEYIKEENFKDEQEKTFSNFLQKCRERSIINVEILSKEENQKYWNKVYNLVRNFLGKQAIYNSIDFENQLIKMNLPDEIEDLVRDFYQRKDEQIEIIKVCPVCGKRIEYKNEFICQSDICRYYIQRDSLKAKIVSNEGKIVELLEGLYQYILIPGIAEENIYQYLKKEFYKYEIIKYPQIDKYDIDVIYKDKVVHLDIKDYKRPANLIRTLEEGDSYKLEYKKRNPVYIVIPNHRIDIYKRDNKGKDYIKHLKRFIDSLDSKINIKVISENQLVKVLKNELENE